MPITWTQADLNAGKAAILAAMRGKAVTFNGRSWTSQDLTDLRSLVAEMEAAVNPVTATNYRLAATRKGT